MKSYWSRVGPSFKMTGVFIKKKERETGTQPSTWREPQEKTKAETGWWFHTPKTASKSTKGRGEGPNRAHSSRNQLYQLWSWTLASRTNVKLISVVRFSQFAVLITAALGNNRGSMRGYGGVMSSSVSDSWWQSNDYTYLSKLKSIHQKECIYSM